MTIYQDIITLLGLRSIILRIDIDSLLFATDTLNTTKIINTWLLQKKYKNVHTDKIYTAISFKKRFYVNILKSGSYEFKASGISLPISIKFTLDMPTIIDNYIQDIDKFKDNIRSRILQRNLSKLDNLYYLRSDPYGMS